jgi:uncharacterized UPF0160 family protein
MRIVTHNGPFHLDDILAVATLLLKFPEAGVVRSRDPEVIKEADIVVDVGQIYDPKTMRFDHHQPSGAGERPLGAPYAAFGLVWKEWGEELAGGKEEAKVIEDKMVIPVDAGDNGLKVEFEIFPGIRAYSLWDYFHSFSDGAISEEEFDKGFFEALVHAKALLEREIRAAKRSVASWKEVEQIYKASENKKILILPENLHWKRVLIPTEAVFVIRHKFGGWSVRGVPDAIHSFDVKKPFPTSWAGLENETLAQVSGVKDAYFCHRNRWIAGARSKEGALELAEKALNA